MPRRYRSRSRFSGNTKWTYTSRPSAGTGKGLGSVSTRSGLPSCQPSRNRGGRGRSARSPRGAPASAQRRSVSICPASSVRASLNSPQPGCGIHGGIVRSSTTRAICFARLRASSYVSSENGGDLVGRWHVAQCANKIGATSLVNVGDAGPPPTPAARAPPGSNAASATTTKIRTCRRRMAQPSTPQEDAGGEQPLPARHHASYIKQLRPEHPLPPDSRPPGARASRCANAHRPSQQLEQLIQVDGLCSTRVGFRACNRANHCGSITPVVTATGRSGGRTSGRIGGSPPRRRRAA
jgi:hypothetical protein